MHVAHLTGRLDTDARSRGDPKRPSNPRPEQRFEGDLRRT